MLSSSQIDNISGIVCNYEHYLVYYYADYHSYQVGEIRDSRIEIYAGSDISCDGNTFFFGDDVECFYLTDSKYLSPHDCPSQFTVNNSEIVYTDCIPGYPDLCYFETKVNNFDAGSAFMSIIIFALSIVVVIRVVMGGS